MYLDEHSDSILENIRANYIPELENLIMNEIEQLESELNSLKINFINLKEPFLNQKLI